MWFLKEYPKFKSTNENIFDDNGWKKILFLRYIRKKTK